LHHANAWVTSDHSTIGAGANWEYANFFDTMGLSRYGASFNAFEKHLLDWLPETAVTTVISDGVIRLGPVDVPTLTGGRTYALKIPKDSERDYWIEMRQSDAEPQLQSGVLLTWSPWSQSNGGTQLLNCNPQSPGQPALQVSHAFYDLDQGLKITPLEFSHTEPQSVDVLVNWVCFIPIELTWPQSPRFMTGRANEGNAKVRSPEPNAVHQATASVQATIPRADSYVVWVQTLTPAKSSDPILLSVQGEEGELGDVLVSIRSWRLVVEPGGISSQRQKRELCEEVIPFHQRGPSHLCPGARRASRDCALADHQ
jgi:hypothetical protein